jgi:tetratricopeptide (TPR) repeat protein
MNKVVPLISLALLGGLAAGPGLAADQTQLMRLLESRRCVGCKLQDADLVRADLRDGDLRKAKLQRANLSGARLDGAKLGGADLSFTSLQGASLRGADLRGALLQGTDLREADLSEALLDPNALARSHWEKAVGVSSAYQSYASLHNAGVESAAKGRYPEAERYFGEAIRKQPAAGISWVARGISRTEQGKTTEAAQDFAYAASLYEQAGEQKQALQLKEASKKLLEPGKKQEGGNGFASQVLSGVMGLAQFLVPIAAQALVAF